MLYESCDVVTEALVVVTFHTCMFGQPAYCALYVIHTLEGTAAVACNAVYLNILAAEFNEVTTGNCSSLYCCHPDYTKNITTSCIITTRRNIHTGYTVAYATDGLSPSIVSLA